MRTNGIRLSLLSIAMITACFVLDGREGIASADTDATPPKPRVFRIPGTAKPHKAAQPPVLGAGPTVPACVLARQQELAIQRDDLLKKHGGWNAAFAAAYTEAKRKLLSHDALEAAGCKP